MIDVESELKFHKTDGISAQKKTLQMLHKWGLDANCGVVNDVTKRV